MPRDVARERRSHDVRDPGGIDQAPDGSHGTQRPVRVLGVPTRDERIRLSGVQRGEHLAGADRGQVGGTNEIDGDHVPVTGWSDGPRPIRPVVRNPSLVRRERPRDGIHLVRLGEEESTAVGRRRAGAELRAAPEIPRPPGAGERLQRREDEGWRSRDPEARSHGRAARPGSVRAVGLGSRDQEASDSPPERERMARDVGELVRTSVEPGAFVRPEVGERSRGSAGDGIVARRPAGERREVHGGADMGERARCARRFVAWDAIASSSNWTHGVTAEEEAVSACPVAGIAPNPASASASASRTRVMSWGDVMTSRVPGRT